MSNEKLTTKEFIEMWYEHYQKRLKFVLENNVGHDYNKYAKNALEAHRITIIELDLALGLEQNMNTLQMVCDGWPDSAKQELVNYMDSVAPTKNSLRYNDERIMNNAKSEDFDWDELDGFDRLVKLKTDCNDSKENIDQLLSDLGM